MKHESSEIKPKRILIFSYVYYPRFIGGAEIAIKEITDRISSKDIEFDLITMRVSADLLKEERVGSVNVHRVGYASGKGHTPDNLPRHLKFTKYLYPFLSVVKANTLHNKKPYDAVWAVMANAGFGALFFKLWNIEVPMVLTLQEGDPLESHVKGRVRLLSPLFRMIFTKANIIQAISNYLGDFARDMGAPCPVEIVPNGVDVKKFQLAISNNQKEEIRGALGLKMDDTVLITTSRLVAKNAVSDVIRALEYLPANIKFIVLGIGPDEKMLKELAREKGVYDRVQFLGFIDHKDMPRYLAVSDIFVRPSLSEGLGNSFIEAMAAGLPIIATKVGGIPDFLRNKETGLFCGVSDPKDIALKVEIYLRDKSLRDEIIENAREMVGERYDWDTVTKQMREKVFGRIFNNQ